MKSNRKQRNLLDVSTDLEPHRVLTQRSICSFPTTNHPVAAVTTNTITATDNMITTTPTAAVYVSAAAAAAAVLISFTMTR